MIFLRLSTASQIVELGPFQSSSDSFTQVSTLTIANTDIKINKHNSNSQVSKNSGGATNISNGWYYTTLDATDTNTVGRIKISIDTASASTICQPVWVEGMVMSSNVFDSMFGSTGTLGVNVVQMAGSTSGANNMSSAALSIISGFCSSGATVSTAIAVFPFAITTDGQIQGRQIIFKGDVTAALKQQAASVSTWTAATSTMTFSALTAVPANTDSFTIF
jgi:hypothetical protein